MADAFDIACLQTRPMPDFEAALGEVLPLAERAVEAGAQMLFLPEYCGGLRSEGGKLLPPSAPEESHPVIAALRDFAARHGVWMQVGSVAVDGPDGRILNRGLMLDDQGRVTGRYDKIHLFDIQLSESEVYRESAVVNPGDRAVIHDTPWARIGHTICYDLRFPHLYRALAQGGAQVLTCPAAFTARTGEAHWEPLQRARAIENTAFMVSACAVGQIAGGGECHGHSMVVSPWGAVVADGGRLPGIVQARIDIGEVAEAAGRIPSLSHDRDYALPGATPKPRSAA